MSFTSSSGALLRVDKSKLALASGAGVHVWLMEWDHTEGEQVTSVDGCCLYIEAPRRAGLGQEKARTNQTQPGSSHPLLTTSNHSDLQRSSSCFPFTFQILGTFPFLANFNPEPYRELSQVGKEQNCCSLPFVNLATIYTSSNCI